jgi:hypothetical protein
LVQTRPSLAESYHELCCYTLVHHDPVFIHQYVVDAFAAQDASETDKPMRLAFALVGLYLLVEKGHTGRQVQQAHMQLARRKQSWPTFPLPQDRGSMTADDVLVAPPGPERDRLIHDWCASVWDAFRNSHSRVIELLKQNGIAGV